MFYCADIRLQSLIWIFIVGQYLEHNWNWKLDYGRTVGLAYNFIHNISSSIAQHDSNGPLLEGKISEYIYNFIYFFNDLECGVSQTDRADRKF
ncbi:hypothetical protein BK140_21320 [Paenibacillus macerans]|nr:hypothetical protein BK140_21320 [Paenibacillus macerans]